MVWVATFPSRYKTTLKSWMIINETVKPVCKHVNMAMQLTITNRQLPADEEDVVCGNT